MLRVIARYVTRQAVTSEQLAQAAVDGDVAIVSRYIREHDNDVSGKEIAQTVSEALSQATVNNRSNVIDLLVIARASINVKNHLGHPLLISAIARGRVSLALHFIEMGADVNCADDAGHSALMMAVICGNERVARKLLAKADIRINAVNKQGSTALMLAASLGLSSIVELLAARLGIDLNKIDKQFDTVYSIAVKRNNRASIGSLLSATGIFHDRNNQPSPDKVATIAVTPAPLKFV